MGVLPPAVHGILRWLQTVTPCHPRLSPFGQGTAKHPSQRNLGGINQHLHVHLAYHVEQRERLLQICIHWTMAHLPTYLSVHGIERPKIQMITGHWNILNIMTLSWYIMQNSIPELGSEPIYALVADSRGCSQAPPFSCKLCTLGSGCIATLSFRSKIALWRSKSRNVQKCLCCLVFFWCHACTQLKESSCGWISLNLTSWAWHCNPTFWMIHWEATYIMNTNFEGMSYQHHKNLLLTICTHTPEGSLELVKIAHRDIPNFKDSEASDCFNPGGSKSGGLMSHRTDMKPRIRWTKAFLQTNSGHLWSAFWPTKGLHLFTYLIYLKVFPQ